MVEGVYNGWLGRPLRILFIGCSSGEEILDFQKLIKKDFKKVKRHIEFYPKILFYGVDKDDEIMEKASLKKYYFDTKFFPRDILDFEQQSIVSRDKNGDAFSTFPMTFDLIVTRNMLIYYGEEDRKKFIDKIISLCHQNSIIVFGKSDPLDFNIQGNKAENEYFQSRCFEERIFRLKQSFRDKKYEELTKSDHWLEAFDWDKMSIFNRYPRNKIFEHQAIQKIVSEEKEPRILIIGAGQGHQVYEIATMVAEECAKQQKNVKQTVIVALEPFLLNTVDIINRRITENDLEELDQNIIDKYFHYKDLGDVKYMTLKEENTPKIIVRQETYQEFAEIMKIEKDIRFDLILCYKVIDEAELRKLVESKEPNSFKSLFAKETILISDNITCKGKDFEKIKINNQLNG